MNAHECFLPDASVLNVGVIAQCPECRTWSYIYDWHGVWTNWRKVHPWNLLIRKRIRAYQKAINGE